MPMKTCKYCHSDLPLSSFYVECINKDGTIRHKTMCKMCVKDRYAQRHTEKYNQYVRGRRTVNGSKVWLRSIRDRAKANNVPFDLTVDDLVVPDVCPILGIPIVSNAGKGHPNSPTVDRKIPALGYVKGNVCVVSGRANRLKQDASLQEVELLLKYLRSNE